MQTIGKETFMNSIKQLPKQFSGRGEVKGNEFSFVSMTDRGFCYEVTAIGIKPHYEVFRLKINNRWACMSYPTAHAFGIWAWTFRKKEMALEKLNEL